MTVSLRQANSRAKWEAPPAIHAPLFQQVLAELNPSRRHVVLDLGAASTAMLDILRQSRSCVEIADLAHFGDCDGLNSMPPGAALNKATESLLPVRTTDEPLDLVFCWDLPNFLTLHSLKALMQSIGSRCHDGTIAHALIFYADRRMPAKPARFIPGENRELVDHRAPSGQIDAPRYSPEVLGDSMGGFRIDRARLLSNGMQEFLFRF